MKVGQPSRTAEVTAAVRAWHLRTHHPPVFADPFALRLTSPHWRLICRSRLASRLVFDGALRRLQPVGAHIIGRARYVEDCLTELRQAGVDQYVLVGAGLDSFGLRAAGEPDGLRVLEVDHPASQAAKRRRLGEIAGALPDNLELIPVDFERERLADGLARSGFDPSRPALFAWLGVVQYLSREAAFQTLASMRECAAPGSEVIFDYIAPRERTPADALPLLDALSRFTARRGEPLKAAFDPRELEAEVAPLGFEVAENLPPEAQAARYFDSYPPRFQPAGFYHLGRLRRGPGP